jgi:hypothetical protein
MKFPSREKIADGLVLLIYREGGDRYQRRPADIYGPLADQFNLDAKARNITYYELNGEGTDEPIWNIEVRFARQLLVEQGYLFAQPRGVWRLTNEGISYAQRLPKPPFDLRVEWEKFIQSKRIRDEEEKVGSTGSKSCS